MKRKKEKKVLPPLLGETLSYYGESPMGKVYRRRFTGKFFHKATVVYSLSLPFLEGKNFEELKAFSEETARNFLAFLEEESKKEGEGKFGGLRFSLEENAFHISAAFCSIKERNFFPAATLYFSPDGKLLRVKKEKAEPRLRKGL